MTSDLKVVKYLKGSIIRAAVVLAYSPGRRIRVYLRQRFAKFIAPECSNPEGSNRKFQDYLTFYF